MAMPSAIGPAMRSARTDEYSVPQMNGRAPNSPETGSQISVCQNWKPNFQIAMDASVYSTHASPATSPMRMTPNSPVPTRNPRSSKRVCFTLLNLDRGERLHLHLDDVRRD